MGASRHTYVDEGYSQAASEQSLSDVVRIASTLGAWKWNLANESNEVSILSRWRIRSRVMLQCHGGDAK